MSGLSVKRAECGLEAIKAGSRLRFQDLFALEEVYGAGQMLSHWCVVQLNLLSLSIM